MRVEAHLDGAVVAHLDSRIHDLCQVLQHENTITVVAAAEEF